jgi:hypothetical protein
MDSKVCVTMRGKVVPPRPWLMVKEFLGARPTVGTGRGGAREGVLPAMLPVVVVLVSGS